MVDPILLLNLVSTLAMVGLIWFVQVVHYPLMGRVGPAEFQRYEREHQRRTALVVAPLMLAEAITAAWLLWTPPPSVPRLACVVGFVLVVLIWASTGLWQVPLHSQLLRGHDPERIRQLVRSNWLRTVAWSLRGGIVGWMTLAVSSSG